MKKTSIIIISSVLVVFAVIIIFIIYKFNSGDNNVQAEVSGKVDLKNATFIIDGHPVNLRAGVDESRAFTDSTEKIVTSYFGNEAIGDLNGDGKEDAVLLLTQNRGGSGTFYYVVAALAGDRGYKGSNAVLLGDRIAPQTTKISDGKIVVNYAIRKSGEPMTTAPSVGFSRHFKVINGQIVEFNILSQITNSAWKWVSTKMKSGEIVTPKKADQFSLTLKDDGTMIGTTDCNSLSGKYKISENKLSFNSLAATLKFCAGSQEGFFTRGLSEVESYLINENNKLIFQLKLDAGSIVLEKKF